MGQRQPGNVFPLSIADPVGGRGTMKAALLKTPLGPLAQAVRDRIALLRAAGSTPETLGAMANDVLARRLLERLCRDGGRFVDVGAHIGSVISGVRQNSRPSEIIAIEAIPEKAARLRKRFPGVTIHCCAVGDKEGQISFFIADKQSGYSSLDGELARRQGNVREINVPIHRLDTLLTPEGIDLVKIDVEGAELGVLRGAEVIVARARPTIMFESGAEEMAGFSKSAMWGWLDARDYAVVTPSRVAHVDGGLDDRGFAEAHLYPPRTTNYFAIARERRDEVRVRARAVLD